MSGQLVGEIIAACDALRERGLSERGFHAAIAIAEKCNTHTRQGSVPWSHIRNGLYGASLSTAKRAVRDLKSVGAITVLRRGFNNQNGRVCAPIYQIELLGERVTQVTRSLGDRTGQIGNRTGQISDRTGHPGDLLNGSTNGSTNGGARASANAPTPPGHPGPEPPLYCKPHMPNGTNRSCRDCGASRIANEKWHADIDAYERRQRRAEIDACPLCDQNGKREVADNCVRTCDHEVSLLQPERQAQ